MTIIGFCDDSNNGICKSMCAPITEFLNQKTTDFNGGIPTVASVDAYDPMGSRVNVFVFNIVKEDMQDLRKPEKKFFIEGVEQDYMTPVFGLVKNECGVYCAMALYYHETSMQVITPAEKCVVERLINAQQDNEMICLCVRISANDSEKVDVTKLYQLDLHADEVQLKTALSASDGCSSEMFYDYACELSDMLSESDFVVGNEIKKGAVLN